MNGPTEPGSLGEDSLGNAALAAYTVATGGLFLYGLPAFWAFSRLVSGPDPDFSQRLGFYAPEVRRLGRGFPRIWIHASSVGEAGVARAVASALCKRFPRAGLIASTGTSPGRDHARRLFGPEAACIYAPLDFPGPSQKALRAFRPHAVVFLETEIWPQWINQCRKLGIPAVVANGRISARSIGAYLRFRPLFAQTLGSMAAFSMISQPDAQRIESMGAPRDRVFVHGNAKYDHLAGQAGILAREKVSWLLQGRKGPVVAAGSTRTGEEEAVLDMFEAVLRRHPQAVLILAPRHVKRCARLSAMIRQRGLDMERLSILSRNRAALGQSVLLVDAMGSLFDLYSLADVVFCGASLVNLGGQNVLEPAAWGKPVLFGPHMDDFAQARDILEASGGGMTVANPASLTEEVLRLLGDPPQARAMGEKALQCIQAHQGAADRHAGVIASCLQKPTQGYD